MPERTLAFTVGGMTCASCAARVEKKLNKLDGVSASVNYATETASVAFPDSVTPEDLVAVVEKTGYTATLPAPGDDPAPEDTEAEAGRTRLLVSLLLAIPVAIMAMVPAVRGPGWEWASLLFATPVATWGAWPFHRAALVNARHGAATMDTLISVGVTASFAWSLYALAAGGDLYLDSAAVVTVLVLLGRYLEARARRSSGAALRSLAELGAKDVTVLRDGEETRIPAGALKAGELFTVRPGEKIAADGTVEAGTSAVDASMLTGEPVPVDVAPGDEVTGGCLNTSGRLIVRARRVGSATRLAQITRLVEEAQNGKAAVQRLADRVSAVFVPAVIGAALITLAAWLLAGQPAGSAFTAAVAVLIIACPCAMGLATPTALMVGTGRGAQLGILIRGPEVLESTRAIDTVVLDKTGTVTTGTMAVASVLAAPGEDEREVLGLAGAVESASEHPIAAAIAQAAADHPGVEEFASYPGLGVSGRVEGQVVLVGRADWLRAEWSLELSGELEKRAEAAEAEGRTVVFAAWDGQVRGAVVVSDTIKPGSAGAIRRLKDLGLHPVLLTGDNERAARAIAAEAGIDDVIAGVLPERKAAVVKELQAAGKVVAMAGDGVNDAAALAQADLGLAMGTGTDAAIEASDLTLVSGDLSAVPDAIGLARRTLGTIKGNLFWAFAYNVAAIPLAALGLLNPMIAAAAMAFSSVFVVTNSLRLRRFRPVGR